MSWPCLSLKYFYSAKGKVLVISERQSTLNENMPLRDAIYYGRTMEKLVESRALYRTGRIQIPTPEFFVFYNGDKRFPKRENSETFGCIP
ncbi:hypothetical protein I5Q83_05820 [Enterocloster clostridioformis]|nr:hypothetical protein [Enterocloster clostridioformis]QQR04229.1 hypothetical protein I5Q83_05820 [Enterocloster clostridioformis]